MKRSLLLVAGALVLGPAAAIVACGGGETPQAQVPTADSSSTMATTAPTPTPSPTPTETQAPPPKPAIKLGELCEGDLAEGQHFLVAFPSRGTHESVKGKGAASFVTFWVGKKGKPAYDGKGPVLIYSRPKGANAGDMGKALLVDF